MTKKSAPAGLQRTEQGREPNLLSKDYTPNPRKSNGKQDLSANSSEHPPTERCLSDLYAAASPFEAEPQKQETIPGGFVVLARQIWESRLWALPDATRIVALHLILRANHKRHTLKVGGEVVHIERGQLWTSVRGLAKGARVSIRKARTALDQLEKLELATHQATHHGMLVTLCNYTLYQNPDNYRDTPSDTGPTHPKGGEATHPETPLTVGEHKAYADADVGSDTADFPKATQNNKTDKEETEYVVSPETAKATPTSSELFAAWGRLWNSTPKPQVRYLRSIDPARGSNEPHVRKIRSRMKKPHWIEDMEEAVRKVSAGECRSFGSNGWRPAFSFLFQSNGMPDILDGKYDDPWDGQHGRADHKDTRDFYKNFPGADRSKGGTA